MQNSLNPARLHFPKGLPMGVCEMIMIATHHCVSEWSVVDSDSDTVVSQNNKTQLNIMQS